jgi:bifunctional N-acetylglucosamine-1-phosphate-uridyltransferase/glucosamine-1-phosphate-acetyltransferase GlmU-like protein
LRPGSPGRALIIPAAGAGSRLKSDLPKFLVVVAGRTLLEWLLDLYRPYVSHLVLVVNPLFADRAREFLAQLTDVSVEVVVQAYPTGMLDAVMLGQPIARAGDYFEVWVTWCDQVAIHPQTAERLALESGSRRGAGVVMPVVVRHDPYIHFERDQNGTITRVLQRREGDVMPPSGEGDVGLFSFSRSAYLEDLTAYAAAARKGTMTGERSLLPFIPWLASKSGVVTFPCVDAMESIGVNTPQELLAIETYLLERTRR